MKNNITLELEDNSELQDIVEGKEAGDTCSLVVEIKIAEKSSKVLTGSIESVAPFDGDLEEQGGVTVVMALPTEAEEKD